MIKIVINKDLVIDPIEKPSKYLIFLEINNFVDNVHDPLLSLKGNEIKVSQCLPGGILPPSTSKYLFKLRKRYEKRNIAASIPHWNPPRCTQCNLCSIICPHAVIRPHLLPIYDENKIEIKYPDSISTKKAFGLKDSHLYTISVSGMDCTGCELCSKVYKIIFDRYVQLNA